MLKGAFIVKGSATLPDKDKGQIAKTAEHHEDDRRQCATKMEHLQLYVTNIYSAIAHAACSAAKLLSFKLADLLIENFLQAFAETFGDIAIIRNIVTCLTQAF
jgi:hypothetical protein